MPNSAFFPSQPRIENVFLVFNSTYDGQKKEDRFQEPYSLQRNCCQVTFPYRCLGHRWASPVQATHDELFGSTERQLALWASRATRKSLTMSSFLYEPSHKTVKLSRSQDYGRDIGTPDDLLGPCALFCNTERLIDLLQRLRYKRNNVRRCWPHILIVHEYHRYLQLPWQGYWRNE